MRYVGEGEGDTIRLRFVRHGRREKHDDNTVLYEDMTSLPLI